MGMGYRVLYILFFSFALSACDSKQSTVNSVEQSWVSLDEKEARLIHNQLKITCEKNNCPDFVAGLTAVEPTGGETWYVSVCSATLIASDLVLTNAHCIPKALRFAGAKCDQDISVKFPANNQHGFEQKDCLEVISVSQDHLTEVQPDWAVLKIKKATLRQPAPTQPRSLTSGEKVILYKVDYNLENLLDPKGQIVSTECLLNTNHYIATHSMGPQSPLLNVGDCDQDILGGNSGSGIFNSEMQMIGLFSFGFYMREEQFYFNKILYPALRRNIGGGTNLYCLPYFNSELDQLCEFEPQHYSARAMDYSQLDQLMRHPEYNSIGDQVRSWNQKNASAWLKFSFPPKNDLKIVGQTNEIKPDHLPLRPVENHILINESKSFNQHQLLIQLYRDAVLIDFPGCVLKSAPQSFSSSLSVRGFALETFLVDQENLSATRRPVQVEKSFIFQRTDKGYRMKSPETGPLFSNLRTDLSWQDLVGEQTIPFCE